MNLRMVSTLFSPPDYLFYRGKFYKKQWTKDANEAQTAIFRECKNRELEIDCLSAILAESSTQFSFARGRLENWKRVWKLEGGRKEEERVGARVEFLE